VTNTYKELFKAILSSESRLIAGVLTWTSTAAGVLKWYG